MRARRLVIFGTLLSAQCLLPTALAFTTSAEDLALLASSEAAFAAAVDAELMPAASSRDYDSGENMRATYEPRSGGDSGAGYGYQPAGNNNYDYGGGGGAGGGPEETYGASGQGGDGDDRGYGRENGVGHHEAGHSRGGNRHHDGGGHGGGHGGGNGGGNGGGYGRHNAAGGYETRRTSNGHRPPVERRFRYERNHRPQQQRVNGQYPRNEYNNERGFTYEKVYPEKVVSHSYKKDYRSPQNNNRPVEWQGGHDRTYSYSNRGAKNYTPRPVVRNYSSNYNGAMNGGGGGGHGGGGGGHGGGRGGHARGRRGGGNNMGNQGYGSPSVKTYDYVDPKAGSRTRLVEMVKGRGARSTVDKYLRQPGGIDRYMNDFMNGASSIASG